MPPRFAYWTILVDQKPTAFRAQHKEDLLPTFHQLQRKSPDAVMKWFARGRLWDSPEQAQWSQRNMPSPRERRDRDWRPGGEHKDPRARFEKPPRERRPRSSRPATEQRVERPAGGGKPWGQRRTPAAKGGQGARWRPAGGPRAPRGPRGPRGPRKKNQG